MSEGSYIQGAGDDSEAWSRGLTPALFWQHKDELLNTPEPELERLIHHLILHSRKEDRGGTDAVRIPPTVNLYLAKAHVDDSRMPSPPKRNSETRLEEVPGEAVMSGRERIRETKYDMVINCNQAGTPVVAETKLDLACRTGKLGSKDLSKKLGLVRDVVQARLRRDPTASILVTCETGRDLCVGVALVLLCSSYGDDGHVVIKPDPPPLSGVDGTDGYGSPSWVGNIDKAFIRRRLAWIVSANPDASPSRATLQTVNALLIKRPD
jgi:tRNA A64-2'-O-ribosylphosphate transferase